MTELHKWNLIELILKENFFPHFFDKCYYIIFIRNVVTLFLLQILLRYFSTNVIEKYISFFVSSLLIYCPVLGTDGTDKDILIYYVIGVSYYF